MKVKLRPKNNKDNPLFQKLINASKPDELEVELGNGFLVEIPTPEVDKLLLEDGVEVDGMQGGIEVDISFIAEDVPAQFPRSSITEMIDEKEVTRQKKWDEYTSYRVSLDNTKALLTIGYRDFNGNRKDIVKHDEFIEWYKYFGRDSMLLNETLKLKIKSDYVSEQDEL